MTDKVEQPQRVVEVGAMQALALLVARLGVIPVLAYHVGAKRTVVVHIRLVVWHTVPLETIVQSTPRLHFFQTEQ